MKKNMHYTTKAAFTAAIILLIFMLAGCGNAVPDRLIGDWQCDDFASGNAVDTGFYAMSIEEDGTFSIYDKEAGNPGISGMMKGDDTGKIGILELNCDSEEFNPPACWPNLKENSRVRYKIADDKTIRLGFVGIWMTFRK